MSVDLSAAAAFLATHGRILDQHRLQLSLGNGDPEATLGALTAYRNRDGGYGHGLEPDLRCAESQPGAALHAFEVFADLAPVTHPHAAALCDWLASVTLPDGGLPFALPIADPAGCAPFWVQAEPGVSSLQITAICVANALRVAAHDPAVAGHPWLDRAAEYCLSAIGALDGQPHALVLAFATRFLDAAHTRYPEAAALLDSVRRFVPADGIVHVAGGAEDEVMRPLDFAPLPGGPARTLFSREVIEAELRRLAGEQQDDGGWQVGFVSYSPAAALEWRGYATVGAIQLLAETQNRRPTR
ncbi:hypothetical protein ABZ863_15355 [Saccharomonospora sp. NPDC046836]|uniref:hypothetical protein n=1 Tax=Saccharomonospora sp. NPDC046836 TaxID=3156921 RepID=UPI00340C5BE1